MRTSDRVALTIALGMLVAVFCLLFYYASRMGGDRRKAELVSLECSMWMIYDRATLRGKAPTPSTVDSNQISAVIHSEGTERLGGLPSFVNPKDVFLPTKSIPVPSRELLFAVQVNKNTMYGIDGSRNFRIVSPSEFQKWPHASLLNR